MSHERFFSKVNGPTLHGFNVIRWLDEVAPRHLAGGGDPRHVTEYLLASGWTNHSVPGYPHVLLESPDRLLHLTLEAEQDELMASWRIHPAQGHAWSSQFGIHTPVEIIAAFVDGLSSAGPRPKEAELWGLAASRGWTVRLTGRERIALSPDETGFLSRETSLAETPISRWVVLVSVPLSERRHRWIWRASIDEAAPPAALAGFIEALTDPAPLLRSEGQTPDHAFGFLDSRRSPVTPEQHRLQHLRRLEAAQRTGTDAPSPAPPPPRTGSPQAAPLTRLRYALTPSPRPRTLMPNLSIPSADDVAQATATLAQVQNYLHTDPSAADVLPVLAALLDEDTGVPILLGDILRNAARLVAQESKAESDEIHLIVAGLRVAAQEATDLHVLHWDVQRLTAHFSSATEASATR
ncbi:DUF317 domain-containing protein [Streptomyces sp. NPDC051913]|uniref:DUF317 domain-containing protein n=1 Tax=Streptomyces sp. NPDC051913 TaxID=3365676 RepID=UPI0037D2BF0B